MTEFLSRKEALRQGSKRYFTGKPCKHGHIAERAVSCCKCVDCHREQDREQRRTNLEKYRERDRERYAADPEVQCAYRRKRQISHREEISRRRRVRRAANLEKIREGERQWRVTNARARCARRKAPLGQLRMFCTSAARELSLGHVNHSRLTFLDYGPAEFIAHLESTLPKGITFSVARAAGYHIDHIIPLSFISASLPVDKDGRILAFQVAQSLENLRMIPGIENLSKGSSVPWVT